METAFPSRPAPTARSDLGPTSPAAGRPAFARSAPLLTSTFAVLAAAGVAPSLLLDALQEARRTGVTPDAALLAAGFDATRFSALMARHLGVRVWSGRETAPRLATGRMMAQAAREGIARLSDRRGWLVVATGRPLARLFRMKLEGGLPPDRVVLTDRANFNRALLECAGAMAADSAANELSRRDPALSARSGATRAQWIVSAAALLGLGVLLLFWGSVARLSVWLILSAVYLASSLVRLAATAVALQTAPTKTITLADADLPVVSILVPLYREARVVRTLIAALSRLDYPAAKLDIKIVVESGDSETRLALSSIVLPPCFEVVVAPRGAPQTKPRALNVALPFCRGSIISVFDAEDHPEPGQLREAAARFACGGPRLACVQGRLTIHNGHKAWIAGLFGFEYAALFDVVTPGMAALRLPIALGGTSNHFRADVLRAVGGWDAWNVTEDIDLGLRLARAGYRVDSLGSSTHEEAPLGPGAWINQRRRWLKGWMQTLVVLTRQPWRLIADLGLARTAIVLLLVVGSLLGPLAGPAFALEFLLELVFGTALRPETLAQALTSTVWCFVSIVGAVALIGPIIIGMSRRGLLRRGQLLIAAPLYGTLLCVAGWLAWWDLMRRPFYWHKTEHGVGAPAVRSVRTSAPMPIAPRPRRGFGLVRAVQARRA